MPITLVVEAGTGLSTANAYVSDAVCAAYHVEMGNAAWAAAVVADARAAAIIQATRYLDRHYLKRWRGSRKSSAQALEWPRYDVVDELGATVGYDSVPIEIKHAACELALRALSATLLADEDRGGAVASVNVGGAVAVQYEPGAPAGKSYRQVDEILQRVLAREAGVRIVRV
jgi:hypothetical protein